MAFLRFVCRAKAVLLLLAYDQRRQSALDNTERLLCTCSQIFSRLP